MPNNPARNKRGYVPVSGALRKVTRASAAKDQRAVSTSLQNKELGGANGTPSPIQSGTHIVGVDGYDPSDQGRYYG